MVLVDFWEDTFFVVYCLDVPDMVEYGYFSWRFVINILFSLQDLMTRTLVHLPVSC